MEKADVFLRDAERHYREGVYWLTCFDAQQAAGVEAPRNLLDYADALTPHYTMARYPGRKPVVYDARRAERCIAQARAIVEWVRSIADP